MRGEILRGRKDTLAPVVSTLRGRAPRRLRRSDASETDGRTPNRFINLARRTGTANKQIRIEPLGRNFRGVRPDTDTDFLRRNGPARTQRSFAAKKSVSVSGPRPCPCSGI